MIAAAASVLVLCVGGRSEHGSVGGLPPSPDPSAAKVTGQDKASSWCRLSSSPWSEHGLAQSVASGSSQAGHQSSFSGDGGESLKATKRRHLWMARAKSRRSDEQMLWPSRD